jgi:hypothetical protein
MTMKVPGAKRPAPNTLLTDARMVADEWYQPTPPAQLPNKPNWERWLYVPSIELGKAIALTLDIAPECLSSRRHLIPDDFKTRLVVAIEHLRPGGVLSDFAGEARQDSIMVTLQGVAKLANLCRWTLPPEFPPHIEQGAEAPPPNCAPPKDAGKRVTSAPPPITPIRGGITRLPRPAAVAPDWQVWRMVDFVAPWEAAALSLGLDPRSVVRRENRDFPDDATCKDFWMQVRIIEGADFPSIGRSTRGIRLPVFVAWAMKKGMEIPAELRALVEVSPQPAAEPLDAAPEPEVSDGSDDRGEQEESAAGDVSAEASGNWKESARAIADELFDHDTKQKTRDSLDGYARRVMEKMQEREIHGPRGRFDNHNTIKREALQSSKWWERKPK